MYPLLINTIIPFFPNSLLLSWYHEIELDLDSSRFRTVEQRSCAPAPLPLPSSASARRPPVEQRLCAPATPLPTEQRVRAGFLPCCAMTGPPTGTFDTEAADLEATAAAAAPPSDLHQQELTVRLAKEKDSAVAKKRQAAYDAAIARLAQAEEEATNASKARDAAIARTDREQALAAATLQPSTPVESSAGGSASPAGGPTDLHSALLLQEAAALLNLHAQAVAVNNIRSLVHIVLDVDSNHFNRWRNQFLLILGKFSLQAHVLAAPVPSPDRDRMDCVVKSWILDSLTDDLAEIVSS
jgi:hypothetical protein